MKAKLDISRTEKGLIVWSVFLILLAWIISRIHTEARITLLLGAIEVILAIATGIAFGVISARRDKQSGM